jgi:hypothetical protein
MPGTPPLARFQPGRIAGPMVNPSKPYARRQPTRLGARWECRGRLDRRRPFPLADVCFPGSARRPVRAIDGALLGEGGTVHIPDAVHELIEWELAVAYAHGYQAAVADIAAGHTELDVAWRPIGRRRHDELVAERIAEMRSHARRLRADLDRSGPPGDGDRDWPPVAMPGRPGGGAVAAGR